MTPNGSVPFTEEEETKKDAEEVQWAIDKAEYDVLAWKRSREAEYPSIQELVVGLYDLDDKSAIEAKRAAVKLKYPKPE